MRRIVNSSGPGKSRDGATHQLAKIGIGEFEGMPALTRPLLDIPGQRQRKRWFPKPLSFYRRAIDAYYLGHPRARKRRVTEVLLLCHTTISTSECRRLDR